MILFFRQWQGELLKLFARRRTYIGFGAFLALEVAILIIFRLKGVERVFERMISRQGMAFEQYYSALTLAFMIMGISVVLLGAIYLALVAGDIVAKEGEDGHYRLLLVRPISRARMLLIKYLTCIGYTFALVQFITWSSFALGLILKGWGGGFFVMAPEIGLLSFYEWGFGLQRFAIASPFCCPAFRSSLRRRPLARCPISSLIAFSRKLVSWTIMIICFSPSTSSVGRDCWSRTFRGRSLSVITQPWVQSVCLVLSSALPSLNRVI
jgi:hypothetical protein